MSIYKELESKYTDNLQKIEQCAGIDSRWYSSKEASEVKLLLDAIFEYSDRFISYYKELATIDPDNLDRITDILVDIQVLMEHELLNYYKDGEESFHKYISALTDTCKKVDNKT